VEWVPARNRILGVAELTPAAAEATKRIVIADLTTIAEGAWKEHAKGNEQKRARVVADLKTRLQWKAWDDVR
jgi:hypothetical protein